MPSRSHTGITSASAVRFEQAVVVLHVHEPRDAELLRRRCSASSSCRAEKFEQPISRTLPAATSLANASSVSRDRRLGIGQVQEVEVDVVGAQPGEALVDGAVTYDSLPPCSPSGARSRPWW